MQLFINNWAAALTAPATASAVQLLVEPELAAKLVGLGGGDYYLLTLALVDAGGIETAWEPVRVTAAASGELTVVRGQEGAVALDWELGAHISARVTAGSLEELRGSVGPAGPAGPVGATGATGAAGATGASGISSVVAEPTTGRALGLTDAGKYIRFTNAGASTATVEPQASVAWEADTEIQVRRAAAESLTLTAGSGVTINAPSGGTLVLTNAMSVTLKRVGADDWDVIGQTVAA